MVGFGTVAVVDRFFSEQEGISREVLAGNGNRVLVWMRKRFCRSEKPPARLSFIGQEMDDLMGSCYAWIVQLSYHLSRVSLDGVTQE